MDSVRVGRILYNICYIIFFLFFNYRYIIYILYYILFVVYFGLGCFWLLDFCGLFLWFLGNICRGLFVRFIGIWWGWFGFGFCVYIGNLI